MPKYAKFLKDLLSNKRKLEDLSHVTLSEECYAVVQNKLPQKRDDPGSFTIPCIISSLSVSNDLADMRTRKRLSFWVNEEEVTFDVAKSMKHLKSHDDSLYFIDTIISHVGRCLGDICGRDGSDTQILDQEMQEIKMIDVAVEHQSSPLPYFNSSDTLAMFSSGHSTSPTGIANNGDDSYGYFS
ncbi:hypothetical protein L1987_09195 [Smallanthus sonchifolius]|uniref:Uncharacterized protein n=1 Tax=Smallanthus sonchifolius TaxID=185202 RepID=A0ACB9JP94_9ASTR|nr:hypothetical protein L1987_09195 [Smallanthus sonchifolius]